MDAAHLHLLTNHIPILLTFLSVAMLVWAVFSKNSEHFKIAFIGFIIAGLAMFLVFESGENAEDIVEGIPGVTHDSIEAHEEAADISRWLTFILAGGGIAGLFMNKRKTKGFRTFTWIILVFALLTAGYLAYTGNLGGQIRHSEITDNRSEIENPELAVAEGSSLYNSLNEKLFQKLITGKNSLSGILPLEVFELCSRSAVSS